MSDHSKTAYKITHDEFGEPGVVLSTCESLKPTQLKDNEVLIRITHSPIHRGDLHLITGDYSGARGQRTGNSRIPGLEAVGVIAEAAEGTLADTGFEVGSRVAFFAPDAWQAWRVLPANALVQVPPQVPDHIAAQMLINTITALHVLRQGLLHEPKPTTIIQTGAASAVGKIITYFAMRNGISPIRLVRSEHSANQLKNVLPGGTVISMSDDKWRDQVREHTTNEITLAFDCVNGSMVGELSDLLAERATIISYGALDSAPSDTAKLMNRGQCLQGVTVGHWFGAPADQQKIDIAEAIDFAQNAPELFGNAEQFDVTNLPAAIEAVTAADKNGSVVLNF